MPESGVAIVLARCIKAHNFQMDSQTCTKFCEKVGHEPKDRWLSVQANWQKGTVAVGVDSNKKAYN